MSYELHGDTGTRLYRIWKSAKCRCNDENHPTYKNYGGRGITFYPEWNDSYSRFKEWAMSHGYTDELELERIDVNDSYTPVNCTWVSHHVQTLNRRDTLYVTIRGHTERLYDLCKKHDINRNTVNNWRYQNVLESKLSAMFETAVTISGGKKVVG